MTSVDQSNSMPERRLRSRKRALVIDDDVLARIETRLLLELQGFMVEEVSDGMEAVGLLDVDAPVLELIVLDRDMPMLSGMETLQALRALQPGLKALFCLAGEAGPQEDLLKEGIAFIRKPLTMRRLAEGLGKVFGPASHPLAHGHLAHSHCDEARGTHAPLSAPLNMTRFSWRG